VARRHDLAPSTVLAAAYAEVLSAWSGQADLTLTFTLFDRRDVHPDIYRAVGDFTSLLLVPYRAAAADGWLDLARRFQERVWTGIEHGAVSAIQVMRDLARRRALARRRSRRLHERVGVAPTRSARHAVRDYAVGPLQTPPGPHDLDGRDRAVLDARQTRSWNRGRGRASRRRPRPGTAPAAAT